MKRQATGLGILLMALVLAGCSSGRASLGTAISGQGQALQAIGDRWSEGESLVEEGHDQVREGNDLIVRGRDLISEGEDNIAAGKAMMKNAEADYRAKTGKDLPEIN